MRSNILFPACIADSHQQASKKDALFFGSVHKKLPYPFTTDILRTILFVMLMAFSPKSPVLYGQNCRNIIIPRKGTELTFPNIITHSKRNIIIPRKGTDGCRSRQIGGVKETLSSPARGRKPLVHYVHHLSYEQKHYHTPQGDENSENVLSPILST